MDANSTIRDTGYVAKLQVVDGDQAHYEIELYAGTTLRVGRMPENELQLKDTKVSRYHCLFAVSPGGVVLSDLASLNGSYVNGRRVSTPINLKNGDAIKIGNAELRLAFSQLQEDSSDLAVLQTEASGMELVTVTILLVDVCGYTRMSEALPGEDVAAMLQRSFSMIADIVAEGHGEVDKYIGDCVMAVWLGNRATAAEYAKKAFQAALQIEQQTLSLAKQWAYESSYPWRTRRTLNSGEALLGSVGSRNKRNFTVLGDMVNVSFRIDGLSSELGSTFLIGEATANFIGSEYPLTMLREIEVEGRNEKVRVFTLMDPLTPKLV